MAPVPHCGLRLLFEAKLAIYIMERQWHPTQELRERSDGRVEMPQGRGGGAAQRRLETTGRKAIGSEAQARRELIRWVLSWMPDVRVLAPRTLRDRIVVKLQDGLRAQEG